MNSPLNPSQEVRFCRQCNSNQTVDNPIRSPLGPGWEICLNCLTQQAKFLTNLKKNRKLIYPEIAEIIQGLYLGNEDAAIDIQTIDKYQIRAVCVCGSHLMAPFTQKKMEGKHSSVLYKKYDIADYYDQKISVFFDENCDWIEERLKEGRAVLVHCAAGVSRSASFIIAYLMNRKAMKYENAIEFVKERRKVICPNSGFKKQLQQYEEYLKKKREKENEGQS